MSFDERVMEKLSYRWKRRRLFDMRIYFGVCAVPGRTENKLYTVYVDTTIEQKSKTLYGELYYDGMLLSKIICILGLYTYKTGKSNKMCR